MFSHFLCNVETPVTFLLCQKLERIHLQWLRCFPFVYFMHNVSFWPKLQYYFASFVYYFLFSINFVLIGGRRKSQTKTKWDKLDWGWPQRVRKLDDVASEPWPVAICCRGDWERKEGGLVLLDFIYLTFFTSKIDLLHAGPLPFYLPFFLL